MTKMQETLIYLVIFILLDFLNDNFIFVLTIFKF